MGPKKILVVDDSCLFQRLLTDVINSHEQLQVVGVASNGNVALEMMQSLSPDLITLDILMPEMDGIQTLIQLRKRWPNVRTIMLSSLTSQGSDAALDALSLGASEYSVKPSARVGVGNIRSELNTDLLPKIVALCGLEKSPEVAHEINSRLSNKVVTASRNLSQAALELVAIGVSTGGPDALTKVLSQLPADFEVPIVIVQHMPPTFTTKLAARLDAASALKVREAKLGDKLRAGTAYIAPGDYHMVLDRIGSDVIVNLNQEDHENSCRPSVDPLFRSIPELYGANCLGVIMTGMGQDGLRGSEALVQAGCSVLVQDKYTSVVWGMPKLVAMAGLADEEIPLDKLASAIVERVKGIRGTGKVPNSLSASNAANAAEYGQKNKSGRLL